MLKSISSFVLVFSFLGACAMSSGEGCADGSCAAEEQARPKVCVMTGEPLDEDSEYVSYNGTEVGFCCKKCVRKWNGMSDAEKKAALAAAGQ